MGNIWPEFGPKFAEANDLIRSDVISFKLTSLSNVAQNTGVKTVNVYESIELGAVQQNCANPVEISKMYSFKSVFTFKIVKNKNRSASNPFDAAENTFPNVWITDLSDYVVRSHAERDINSNMPTF